MATIEHYIDQRLSFASALCTVRYIGAVNGTKGEWLGVEWDDPGRGKHSGEHDGVRYFECKSKHPTAGSFVRPNRPRDHPNSFLEALHKKYAYEDPIEPPGTTSNQPIILGGKVVEEVGFDKIRKQQAVLRDLRVVLLDGCRVAGLTSDGRAGDKGRRRQAIEEIRNTCPNIVELDLSRNLIERWEEVAGICAPLERLRSLRLNGNRFSNLGSSREENVDDVTSPFDGVKELSFDENLLSWEDIALLVASFPSLTTLFASSNNLSTLTVNPNSTNLTKIVLEENQFTSLSVIKPLCELPLLQSLYLGHNAINGRKGSPESKGLEPIFPESVTYLDLSYNEIDNWDFINQLQYHFPGLTGLRIAHNPLYEDKAGHPSMGVEESFMLTLARLPCLKILNFSNITPQERTNAEIYYLSRITKELEAVSENEENQVIQNHPRYSTLCELYGPPTIKRQTINPNSLSARLVRFEFISAKPANQPDQQVPGSTSTKTHRLPRSLDIYRLKGIVGRLFGLRPNRIKLIWETGEWDPASGLEEEEEEEEEEEDKDDDGSEGDEEEMQAKDKGRWVTREVELLDGIRDVGFWIEGGDATIRVEQR
ncbi:MAG: hypothetical protein M1816_001122 [Peltula sp. TS41687]|nr:MAG: hypothetical protein M1816_001122 [Peltula sp. TS41687]